MLESPTCLKCQKVYNPTRRGGLFCSVSCGNSYRQQLKRNEQQQATRIAKGHVIEKPLTDEELELWHFIKGLAGTAKQILADKSLPDKQRPEDLRSRVNQFVKDCEEQGNSQLIRGIASRYRAQEEAAKRVEEGK